MGLTGFLTPTATYRLDLTDAALHLLWQPDLGLDLAGYEVRQEFALSRDGTRVPMFIVGSPTAHREAETAKAHRG